MPTRRSKSASPSKSTLPAPDIPFFVRLCAHSNINVKLNFWSISAPTRELVVLAGLLGIGHLARRNRKKER